jgi:hypothetical protein
MPETKKMKKSSPPAAKVENNQSTFDLTMNKTLQLALKNEFKKKGILAYTNCCRWGCTGAYDEEDDFEERETKGIYFIRLHTDGMNYKSQPTFTTALYEDFDYLMDNWVQECTILDKWCEVHLVWSS